MDYVQPIENNMIYLTLILLTSYIKLIKSFFILLLTSVLILSSSCRNSYQGDYVVSALVIDGQDAMGEIMMLNSSIDEKGGKILPPVLRSGNRKIEALRFSLKK